MKRYNLVLTEELFNAVQSVAEKHSMTVAELMRKFIKAGLLATRPGAQLIVREGDKERLLLLL